MNQRCNKNTTLKLIKRTNDHGVNWREKLQEMIEAKNYHIFICPLCNKAIEQDIAQEIWLPSDIPIEEWVKNRVEVEAESNGGYAFPGATAQGYLVVREYVTKRIKRPMEENKGILQDAIESQKNWISIPFAVSCETLKYGSQIAWVANPLTLMFLEVALALKKQQIEDEYASLTEAKTEAKNK
jgi:hypothetical protein